MFLGTLFVFLLVFAFPLDQITLHDKFLQHLAPSLFHHSEARQVKLSQDDNISLITPIARLQSTRLHATVDFFLMPDIAVKYCTLPYLHVISCDYSLIAWSSSILRCASLVSVLCSAYLANNSICYLVPLIFLFPFICYVV